MRAATAGQASVAIVMLAVPLLVPAAEPQESQALRTDSRAPYVHRLTLYDDDGIVISPSDPLAAPYSPARTCGKCHAYGTISSGWHFNAPRADVGPGRPGEPWVLVDAASGTQLPLSARSWPGTFTPQQVGLTDWQFVLRFGHHLPGGGPAEPVPAAVAAAPEAARWRISGPLQIDCLVCHSADGRHDPAETARQIERENFRWSATAALGVAVVRGDARQVPDDWDPLAPPNPDFPEQAGPKAVYDRARFDTDDRVFFSTTKRCSADRCYFCHTVREVDPTVAETPRADSDVHLTAGLTCVDCHRHGLDHAIGRGFEGEGAPAVASASTALTCRGCHLGDTASAPASARLDGRLGAPRPRHRGLPPLHLRELSCTACHCGPWPTGHVRRLQTSLAHGLGIGSKERAATTPPEIYGPVFVMGEDEKLTPHRMLWPAFWGILTGDAVRPLPLDRVQAALGISPRSAPSVSAEALTPDAMARGLAALAEAVKPEGGEAGTPVYVRAGLVHARHPDGSVRTFEHPAAKPYVWPLGHDVRPARQALGAGGCTDCHARDAAFSFGRIVPETAEQTDRPPIEFMYELQGESPVLLSIWASSFAWRLTLKIIGFGCVVVLAAVLLLYGFSGLSAVLKLFS